MSRSVMWWALPTLLLLGCTPMGGGFYTLDPAQRRVVLDVEPTEAGIVCPQLRLVAVGQHDDLEIRLYLSPGWRFGSPDVVMEDGWGELLMGWLESPDREEPIRDWWLLGDREALCGYVTIGPGTWRIYVIVEREP